ncbi:23S rRNA (guanosine(2251)-2'-O)-methyltransferase RlmB [Roseospira navarrensis]|uniref:23S rRNA (Guanosine(2251)-2'-O)-methyltransferase RlmB n=1 Tax=Roseospira navarrensis TaxID=140058 RepID=A0A7X2D6R6_9PROT|nr:23S rRNA (guanosine(2251)-2'-O)-methyltransferase RlmB [Roseospira navarrensis]MQX38530.1 23S rRNA (guanosine(2251)-2'-O)-methyltransferase RlmB [Roseospira navarrensis]
MPPRSRPDRPPRPTGPTHPGPARRGPPGGPRKGGGAGPSATAPPRLYGRHAVLAALRNPARPLRRLWVTSDAADTVAEAAAARALSVDVLTRPDLETLLPPGAVHQGLALEVGPLPAPAIQDLPAPDPGDSAVVVVLDQVSDPHNVGAILRSAAAFGAVAVVTQDRHAPPETGALAKAASGALERVPLIRVPNLARALEDLRDRGYWSVGLEARAPATVAGAGLHGGLALVLGAEGSGLRRLTRERCDHLARLPMVAGAAESLNVSNACAVALYELRRTALEDLAKPGL